MNGKEQTEAMAELAKPWKPDHLDGIRVGDAVRLPGIDATLEVVALNDPMLTLRAPSGKELKAGWQAVQKLPSR